MVNEEQFDRQQQQARELVVQSLNVVAEELERHLPKAEDYERAGIRFAIRVLRRSAETL